MLCFSVSRRIERPCSVSKVGVIGRLSIRIVHFMGLGLFLIVAIVAIDAIDAIDAIVAIDSIVAIVFIVKFHFFFVSLV